MRALRRGAALAAKSSSERPVLRKAAETPWLARAAAAGRYLSAKRLYALLRA